MKTEQNAWNKIIGFPVVSGWTLYGEAQIQLEIQLDYFRQCIYSCKFRYIPFHLKT